MALCINCVSGRILPGNPKGSMEKIGPYESYIAKSNPSSTSGVENNETNDKAIILFTDAYGLRLINSKILADILSERTGITVYVPDLFNGEGLDPDAMSVPSTAAEIRSKSFLTRTTDKVKMLSAIPWALKNFPTRKVVQVEEYINVLRDSHKVKRLGAVGYCYGGRLVADFNTKGLLDATVVCHPSFTNAASYGNLKAPIQFNCAEEDSQFPVHIMEQVRAMMTNNDKSPKHDFKVFVGTAHSFCARPDLGNETVKKAFEEATTRTSDWFKTHL